MAFVSPSIHRVRDVRASVHEFLSSGRKIAAVDITITQVDGSENRFDMFFDPAHIDRAHRLAAAINAAGQDEDESAAPVAVACDEAAA